MNDERTPEDILEHFDELEKNLRECLSIAGKNEEKKVETNVLDHSKMSE